MLHYVSNANAIVNSSSRFLFIQLIKTALGIEKIDIECFAFKIDVVQP